MKRKIYIAGPMTGYEYFNFKRFDAAKRYYEAIGYEVFSPADHDRSLLNKPVDWVGADLQWIAKEADEIAMLPGWENSRGANAEWALAKALDLKIRYYP